MTKNAYDFLSWYPKEGNHFDILKNHRMKFFKKIKQFLIILNKEKIKKKKYSDENLLEIDTFSDYFGENKNEKKNSDIKIYIGEYSSKTENTNDTSNQNYINKNEINKKKNKGYRKNSTFFDPDSCKKEENKFLFSTSPLSFNEIDINNNSMEDSFDGNTSSK